MSLDTLIILILKYILKTDAKHSDHLDPLNSIPSRTKDIP